MRFILFVLLTTLAGITAAQKIENRSSLNIEDIMQGERFIGYLPENPIWSDDGSTLFFTWNPEMDTLRRWYKTTRMGEAPIRLTPEEVRDMSAAGRHNRDRTMKVYSKDGDIFLIDLRSGEKKAITQTQAFESSPRFSGDEKFVIYQSGDNLFAWNIQDGVIRQLTDFRSGNEMEARSGPQEKWLEADQLALFEVLRERKETSETRERRNEAIKPKRPLTIRYGDRTLIGLDISPDLRYVVYRLMTRARPTMAEMPDYVTSSGFTTSRSTRPKVGAALDQYELGIYDTSRDTFYWVAIDNLEGIRQKPEFLSEYHRDTVAWIPQYEKPRSVFFFNPVFSEDGKPALVLRSQDNKDRWITLLDLHTGTLSVIDHQRDEAWIGGPGMWGSIGWLGDNTTIWYQSEVTGYSHLYTANVLTGEKKALTSGSFEILDVDLSNDKQFFHVRANAEGPHEQHFYRLPVTGGVLEKITSAKGCHEVVISPDEKYLAVLYSYSNKPWEMYIMENKPGAQMMQVTHSLTNDFRGYAWREPDIVWFTARDGVKVPARLYKPKKPAKNHPAILFVHGAGYLQNVHYWWSQYYREYMFHNFLADNGFTVLDIDYRGSAGYGRDWRTAIYRHMGGWDLTDQVDGAGYLVEHHGVNPNRIGIYGGSYGGFITLMALFTQPGKFHSGAALRSVTDWAHYNHGYTSNILNTPVEDSIAYRRSSPIYHAVGLQDRLLMLHGMVDDNVHFQDIVRLQQRLIELKKENWELAIYPLESHGFVTASGWTDEYKRIWKLFYEMSRL